MRAGLDTGFEVYRPGYALTGSHSHGRPPYGEPFPQTLRRACPSTPPQPFPLCQKQPFPTSGKSCSEGVAMGDQVTSIDRAYIGSEVRRAIATFFAPLRLAWRLTCTTFRAMDPDEDGWCEWTHPLPGYLMKCCGCGLVHEMQFEIVPHGAARTALNPGEGKRKGVIIFRAKRHGADPQP